MSRRSTKRGRRQSNIFSIDNFDSLLPEEEPDDAHPLAPRWPFNMLISGGTGCGKTTVLINMLLKQLEYDSVFLYSRDLEEDKYVLFKKICQQNGIECEWVRPISEDAKPRASSSAKNKGRTPEEEYQRLVSGLASARQHDAGDTSQGGEAGGFGGEAPIIDIDTLNPEFRHVIIFDDLVNEKDKKIIKRIEDCFIRGRKRNVSSIYISHQFYKTPKMIRDNCQYFLIFKGSRRDRTELFKSFGDELEAEDFYAMYDEALRSQFAFFMIDRRTKDDRLRYRAGFDGVHLW